jgi:ATP-binding cassette subfamily C protein CydC
MLATFLVLAGPVQQGLLEGTWLVLAVLGVWSSLEVLAPLGTAVRLYPKVEKARHELQSWGKRSSEIDDTGNADFSPAQMNLEFDAVSFSYGEQTILKDIQFDIAQGEKVAIVGPSGSGKSTIGRLLMRFFDPDNGIIKAGGVDLKNVDAESWRQNIAMVDQHAYLFNRTLRQNLLLADPHADEKELWRALDRAGLDSLVRSWPKNIDTPMGEHGMRLSGGERRRVGLARALLKEAPIWLLDEPTSHLDSLTERQLLNKLHRLAEDKTVLLITHRLVQMEKMDQIIVMLDGKVKQKGTHEELKLQKGWYRTMLQYQDEMLHV